MNLRDQLKEILPDILPRNPGKAIKGTELIESVRDLLESDYSDATLRYHFSIMSVDPSAPIAKVEQGQGYYLRSTTIHTINSARIMIGGEQGSNADSELSILRINKFRAITQRYLESIQSFPFTFERSFSTENAGGTRWQVPDLTGVKWLVTEQGTDDSIIVNREKLEVQRRMGDSPFELTNVKLRLEVSADSILETLFQTLSASRWANRGELMVASPIRDVQAQEEMRRFATDYGVGVTSFNMEPDMVDDLPEPAAIKVLTASEFDQIMTLIDVQRITSSRARDSYEWKSVTEFAKDNLDFAQFEGWINHCLITETVVDVQRYIEENQPVVEAEEDAVA